MSLSWVSLDTRVTLSTSLDHLTLSLVKSKLKCGELYLTEITSCLSLGDIITKMKFDKLAI